ncbi:probable hexosyltransferase [uncultured Candidatus Thioglobus sp.]|nr:probable hexosyltransferase [uncultured Candidatus Thioglobus sp.]
MKILHVANFAWFHSKRKRSDNIARYYATDHKISNGLIRNGHCVWDFSYRDTARHFSPFGKSKKWGAANMNATLIMQARAFAPDLILLGHTELVTPQTLATLRKHLPDTKIAQWWVDWFLPHSLSHLRKKQSYLDAFFATTAPEYYAPLLQSSTPSHYLPNIVDSSVETERAFATTDYKYDVFFAGSDASERAPLLESIKNIPEVCTGFFGFGGRPFLSGAVLAKTIAIAKIGLNFSRADDIPLYSSARLAQLIGNGCAVVMPHIPHMQTLFNEHEVAYFSEAKDLVPLITELLNDDERRQTLARAGWQRAHASYNEQRICKFITEATMGESFSEQYEWLPFSRE